MNGQTYRVSIEILAEKAKQGISQLKAAFVELEKGTNKAGRELEKLDRQSQMIGKSLGLLKGALGALGLGMGLSSIIQTADSMQVLNDQVRLATGTTEKYGIAMQNIERIAMQNKVSLQSVGEMYVSNERALKQLGKGQEEVIKFTENVTKAMRVGGGSASAQAAALTQLGQAMASGVLRGDEFNSIAEQAPMIMELLADSLNVTTGELRKMAAEGKLTAETVYQALTSVSATDKLGQMTGKTATTVAGAMQEVSNQWEIAVNKIMNGEGGISQALAGMISNFAGVIPKVVEFGEAFIKSKEGQAIIDGVKTAVEMLKGAVTGIGDLLAPIGNFLSTNPEFAISLASGIGAAAAAFGAFKVALSTISLASGVLAALTNPIGLVVVGIAALVAAGVYLYRNWDTIKAKASEVWNAIPQYADQAWQWIQGVWSGVGAWFGGIWDGVKSAVSTAIDGVKQAFFDWLAGMPAPVQEMVANIGSIFKGLVSVASAVWNGLLAVVKFVADGIVSLWQGFVSIISGIWNGIVNVATTVWNGIVSVVTSVINAIKPIVSSVVSFFSSVWQGLVGIAKSIWEGIKSAVSAAMTAIKAIFTAQLTVFASVFNAGFALVKNIFTTAFNVIKALVRGDMEGVKNAISSGLQNAASIARTMVTNIVGVFKNLGAQLLQAGRDAVQGFINGFSAKMNEAYNKAREMASKVVSVVKGALDIHSPSRVMKALGGYAGEGFALGLGEKVKDAKRVAQDLANAVTSTIQDLHKNLFMLQNHANPLAELDYKIQFGELAELTDAQKARIKALAQANLDLAKSNDALASFNSAMADLDKQLAMLGVTDPIKQLEYDLANSEKYAGYTTEQLDRLKSKMLELEQAKALQGFNSELEKATTEMQKQEYLLKNIGDKYAGMKFDLTQKGYNDEQISQMVGVQERTDTITAFGKLQESLKNGKAFTLPTFSGQGLQGAGNALANGIKGMASLDQQYQEQLEIIKNARQAQLDINADYNKQEQDLLAAHEAAKRELTLSSAEGVASGLSSATKSMFGEQSKVYRAMFAMEQGVAIARSVMAIQQAIAFASANPFPMNLGAMATVAAQTMGIVAKIKAIKNPVVGQAHDGIMSVPKSGTWNLEKGERVLPKHTAQNLDNTLNRLQGNGKAVNVIIHNHTGEKVQQTTDNNGDIRIIIGQELAKQLPNQVNDPYSGFNKALKNNYQLQRRL